MKTPVVLIVFNRPDTTEKVFEAIRQAKPPKLFVIADAQMKYWDMRYKNDVDTWDYQWHFACMCQGSYSIVPNKNLISNIGFGEEALHTKNSSSRWANLKTEPMDFPLVHPKFFIKDTYADKIYMLERKKESTNKIHQRIVKKIKSYLKGIRN